jgi:DNA repair exonuclease SbcCD nuclease subunit
LALRLLHFADLHLDRSFASQRLFGVAAQRRREDLRAALQRVLERAEREQVDLITCAGDLFEHDHITRETATFLAQSLGQTARPILIAPGHSDPATPSSPYRYLRWPTNVTVAAHEDLRPYVYGGINIWAAGFNPVNVSESPLSSTPALGEGTHLLLLHASDMHTVPDGVTPVAPIVQNQVEQAGFRHALLGHYHDALSQGLLTYPGSPEPLGWDEGGRHCVALVTVSDDQSVSVDLQDINQRRFVQETLDVTGMTSRDQVRDALLATRESQHLDGAVLRARLVGERSQSLDLDPRALALECNDGFAHLEFLDETRRLHDLQAVGSEFTSRGEMVRQLQAQRGDAERDETVGRALQLALDAFES